LFLLKGMRSAAGRIEAAAPWVASDHFEELGRPPRLRPGRRRRGTAASACCALVRSQKGCGNTVMAAGSKVLGSSQGS
jgi:hypothetical protein